MPLVGDLRIFLSARMERNRKWPVFWGKLNVVLQHSLSWTHKFTNVLGYKDESQIHIPYDTFFRLFAFRPDAIISGEFGARTLLSTLYRITYPKTLLIVWATLSDRTESTRGSFRALLRRWLLRKVDGVFVNGRSGAKYILSLGFTGRVFTIPYVVDNAAFNGSSTVEEDGWFPLFCVSQLVERKGLHPFLVALRDWCQDHPDRCVALRIAGSGPERERLEMLRMPRNLRVELLGDIAPSQLPSYYHAALIFVFPTLADEWGVVVNEALSAGLPVLGSIYSQAVEELVVEGSNGWIFNPSDEIDTRRALHSALTVDSTRLQNLSENARASMIAITPPIIAAKMVDSLNTLGKDKGLL